MRMEIILSIVGSFGVLALGINGFFLRGIFNDLNDVRIQIAVLISESKEGDKMINKLERKLEHHESELSRTRDRLHSLEGASVQVLQFIKETPK